MHYYASSCHTYLYVGYRTYVALQLKGEGELQMKNNKRKNQKGFTLMELVTTIALMGIAAAALAPSFTSMMTKYRLKSDIQSVKILQNVIDIYNADYEGDQDHQLIFGESGTIPKAVYQALANKGYITENEYIEGSENSPANLRLQINEGLVKYNKNNEKVILDYSHEKDSKLGQLIHELNISDKNWVVCGHIDAAD